MDNENFFNENNEVKDEIKQIHFPFSSKSTYVELIMKLISIIPQIWKASQQGKQGIPTSTTQVH